MSIKDLAICIHTVDYSETSQILTFFTQQNGKISAIAKGSKRLKSNFDGTIEMFAYGQIMFSQTTGKLYTLSELHLQKSFYSLSKDMQKLNFCLFAAELINSMIDEADPHPALFDQFLQYLENISESADTTQTFAFLILFQLAILREIGLGLSLNFCSNCKAAFNDKWLTAYFDSSANSFICRDCESSYPQKIQLSKNAAAVLNNLNLIANADMKTLKEIEKVLIYHFTEILHRPPRMAKYV